MAAMLGAQGWGEEEEAAQEQECEGAQECGGQ